MVPRARTPGRFRVTLLALALGVALPGGASAQNTDAATDRWGWWEPSHLVDYGLVTAGTIGYIAGRRLPPRSDPLWGPGYDPDDPAAIFDADGVHRRFRERDGEVAVPRSWIHGLIAGAGVFVAGLETGHWARGDGSLQRIHDTSVGYLETVALTAAATALTKPFVGRLRPDFGDRARRYHCPTEREVLGDACGPEVAALADDPAEAADLLDDGQRSFFSGHASHAVNLFGYSALVVGGRYVWADGASGRGRALGVAGQVGMMGAATWIAESRISDRRHHPSDVVVGAVVGLAFANVSYWRRFDGEGASRARTPDDDRLTLHPWAASSRAGLTVVLRTP